ncbi:fimbrial protein [Xanthomonas cassavae CFBP 4642]|uniref:Fimbrial protein n=1 Tax=Xanthomonas cassavae CFBP 4642 TaxID=1219375 RepID=A0ABS8HP83_9XANT|nr:fimbrial protein [Xanthomonas cassavae CFBP 4642]
MVNLGEVRAAALAKKGATSTPVSFSIKLSDCVLASSDTTTDSYSTAAVTFVGTPVGSDNTVLALNGGDGAVGVAAANVGIQILQDAEPVAIAGSQSSAAKPIVAGENTLYFGAQYVATAAGATAGAANSSLTFNLTYE